MLLANNLAQIIDSNPSSLAEDGFFLYFSHVKVLPIIFSTISLLTFSSCLKDKTIPLGECGVEVSYAVEIRPIIESSCKTQAGAGTGCHDAWIDDYSGIQGQINSGNWQNEVFVERTMPEIPNDWGIDSLSQDEIKTMQCWIEQGYPEN